MDLERDDETKEEEEELLPLPLSKSLSLPIARQPQQGVTLTSTEASIQLIKSLMALLTSSDEQSA
jgi:hypothetical protein